MTDFVLAGVMHSVSDRGQTQSLMTTQCMSEFKRRVVPRVTSQSVIFAEGSYRNDLVFPEAEEYKSVLGSLEKVFDHNIRPAFGFKDPRWSSDVVVNRQRIQIASSWILHANKVFEFRDIPTSYEEMIERIRAKDFRCSLKGVCDSKDLEHARHVMEMNRRFNRNYVGAMNQRKGKSDLCVLVAGFAHCMSVALHTNWPIEALYKEDVEGMYLGYMTTHVCPQLILRVSV